MQPNERAWRERCLRSAVLSGDERAWQTWYDESFDALNAYVNWRCAGLGDLADEVVQDTWLTAVRRIRTFDPDQGSFLNWLRGIAAMVLRNHWRRRGRSPTSLNGRCLATDPLATALDQREQAERVARALSVLPERYEAVLRAKYLDGHSMAQIAAAGNETIKAVESLLSRARQAFRQAYLSQEEPHD
jgi:RNA polymerase sigma-70 factor (ECF subfamily)